MGDVTNKTFIEITDQLLSAVTGKEAGNVCYSEMPIEKTKCSVCGMTGNTALIARLFETQSKYNITTRLFINLPINSKHY